MRCPWQISNPMQLRNKKRATILTLLLCIPCFSVAEEPGNYGDEVIQSLPVLPDENASPPGHLDLLDKSLSVNYTNLQQKWRASIDEYKSSNPMVSFDYGMRLSNEIAAGGRVSSQRDFSEVLVNAVYAPHTSLRLTLSGGQLHPNSDFTPQTTVNGYTGSLQNSYLLDVKKYWTKDSLISDLGLSTYLVEANGRSGANRPALAHNDNSDTDSVYLGTTSLGKKASLVLNLGVNPTADSRFEWRRERSRLDYTAGEDAKDREYLMSSRFKYSHNLDTCTQFQGRYRSSENFDRLNLGLERKNWNISVSRTRDDSSVDTGFQIGYKIPLSGTVSSASTCSLKPDTRPVFKPLLETTTKRPDLSLR